MCCLCQACSHNQGDILNIFNLHLVTLGHHQDIDGIISFLMIHMQPNDSSKQGNYESWKTRPKIIHYLGLGKATQIAKNSEKNQMN